MNLNAEDPWWHLDGEPLGTAPSKRSREKPQDGGGRPGRQAGTFASLSELNQEAGGDPQHVATSSFQTEVMQPWDSRAVGAELSLTCSPR